MKGGTSQYKMKERSGKGQEQTPDKTKTSASKISQATKQGQLHGEI
jgi:hypothetical protein